MKDMIYRADAIRVVAEHFSFDDGCSNVYKDIDYYKGIAEHILKNVPSALQSEEPPKQKGMTADVVIIDEAVCRPRGEWIPVSERLPEEYGEYLVTVREKYSWDEEWDYKNDLAYYKGSYIGVWDTSIDWKEGQEVEITAWMPLPDAYKGGDTE